MHLRAKISEFDLMSILPNISAFPMFVTVNVVFLCVYLHSNHAACFDCAVSSSV